jgi:hypothetical protein
VDLPIIGTPLNALARTRTGFSPGADTLVVVPQLNIPIPRVLFTLFLACCQDDG